MALKITTDLKSSNITDYLSSYHKRELRMSGEDPFPHAIKA